MEYHKYDIGDKVQWCLKKITEDGIITIDKKLYGTIIDIPIVTDALREKYEKLSVGSIEKDEPIYFIKTNNDWINSNRTLTFMIKESELSYY